MKLLVVLLGCIAAASAHDSSVTSFCIPTTPDSTVPVPPCIEAVVTSITSIAPSFSTDISIIEGVELSSPSFATVETVIESYERTYASIVSVLESYLASPSLVTSSSYLYELESGFTSLAHAISLLVSVESSHPSISAIQTTMQSVMSSYSSALTIGSETFSMSHNYLRTAISGVSEVTLTSPSIISDVNAITTVLTLSPYLDTAVSTLESFASSSPSVISAMTRVSSWTSTTAWYTNAELISLRKSYISLYEAAASLDSFVLSHSSISSALTGVVSALTVVPSIITDVSEVVIAVSPTFVSATKSIFAAAISNSDLTTDISYIDELVATDTELSCAEHSIAYDMVAHGNTVTYIESALRSPSLVISTTYVSHLEAEFPSIVTAYYYIVSAEYSNPYLAYVQTILQSQFVTSSTLITAVNQVISATSSSVIAYADAVAVAVSVSPTITYEISVLTAIFDKVPSLSCAEDVIEKYASYSPSVIEEISEDLSSPSLVASSSVRYVKELTAEYESLASALRSIIAVESSYSSLATAEQAITYVMLYEPSIVSDYESLSSEESVVSCEVSSTVPFSVVAAVQRGSYSFSYGN